MRFKAGGSNTIVRGLSGWSRQCHGMRPRRSARASAVAQRRSA